MNRARAGARVVVIWVTFQLWLLVCFLRGPSRPEVTA